MDAVSVRVARRHSLTLERVDAGSVGELTDFLSDVDLTLSALAEPSVRLWIERDHAGRVVGSTGYELRAEGGDALIRSVAVHPAQRTRGRGRALAEHAIAAAREEGARRAWLFSRRSGPFWQSLGFVAADREELVARLGDTHQVSLFVRTGQIEREVAWTRPL